MNLADRNLELDKARAISVQITQAETRLDAIDDDEGALKDDLEDAQREFNALMRNGKRGPPRKLVLNDLIHEIHDKLHALARAPSIIQNDLRKLGSDLDGFRARDWWWLKSWRDGQEKGMDSPVDVEDEAQCTTWLNELHVHLDTFPIGDSYGRNFITKCENVLANRRRNLVEGRARNAEADALARRMHADLVAEKERRVRKKIARSWQRPISSAPTSGRSSTARWLPRKSRQALHSIGVLPRRKLSATLGLQRYWN